MLAMTCSFNSWYSDAPVSWFAVIPLCTTANTRNSISINPRCFFIFFLLTSYLLVGVGLVPTPHPWISVMLANTMPTPKAYFCANSRNSTDNCVKKMNAIVHNLNKLMIIWCYFRSFGYSFRKYAKMSEISKCVRDVYFATTASASISTNISGSIKRLTSTMLVAGRISLKNSPCATPTFSQSLISFT